MGRFLMVFGLAILFAGWALYRLFIKRDLMQHKDTLFLGLFFMGIRGVVYILLWA
ncbi:MAG: hypothetical protein ABI432_18315 [Flavobacteriales bacterium]